MLVCQRRNPYPLPMGYLPPHPAPATAIAATFNADIGKTLLYGTTAAIPAIIVAGPLLKNNEKHKGYPVKGIFKSGNPKEEEMPSTSVSILTALLPVILIAISALAILLFPEGSTLLKILVFIGNPVIAMLISVLVAIYTLGLAREARK